MVKRKAQVRKGQKSFPSKDAEFDAFQKVVMKKTKEKKVPWGINQAFLNDTLIPLEQRWNTAWAACQDKHTVTSDMKIEKDAAREAYEAVLRIHVGGLQHNPDVAKEELEEMSIATKKGGFHPKKPVTDTKPQVGVDTSKPGQLGVNVWEEDSDSKAMPENSSSVEFRIGHLDHEPKDVNELMEVITIYQTHMIYNYILERKGEVVYIVCRWVSPTGEKGPWSEVYRAVLP